MASEMIERVAEAIRKSEAYWWNRDDEPEEGLAETLAKIAIEALTTDDLLKELDRRLGSTPVEE